MEEKSQSQPILEESQTVILVKDIGGRRTTQQPWFLSVEMSSCSPASQVDQKQLLLY